MGIEIDKYEVEERNYLRLYFKSIGCKIKELMDKNNINISELSAKTGVKTKFINKIINGTVAINMREIGMFASALGVDVESLLPSFYKGTMPDEEFIREFFSEYNKLKDRRDADCGNKEDI